MARARKPGNAKTRGNGNGAKLGFEETLWQAADALRDVLPPEQLSEDRRVKEAEAAMREVG